MKAKIRHTFNYLYEKIDLLLPAVIAAAYFIFSLQFIGPAYLSDELGYLSKAATLTGDPVDLASSWRGGYALLIAPAFLLFENPFLIWKGVLFLNAVMWGVSFWLLFKLLSRLFPTKTKPTVISTVLLSSLYPAFITMSGYAFPTSGFVLFFMLATFFLYKSRAEANKYLVLHALAVGFLCWIHPLGIIVAIASSLLLFLRIFVAKKRLHILGCIGLIGAIVLLYQFVIHPLFDAVMTPSGFEAASHYELGGSEGDIGSTMFWENFTLWLLGRVSYLLIGSVGVLGYAAFYIFRKNANLVKIASRKVSFNSKQFFTAKNTTLLFILIVPIGIFTATALKTAMSGKEYIGGVHYWVYGRYLEMVILPLLGVGFMALWRASYAIYAALIVLISAVLFNRFVDATNTDLSVNNLVNIAALWPYEIESSPDYLYWFVLGAIAILATMAASLLNKRLALLIFIPLFLIGINVQQDWHNGILAGYSKPGGLYQFVSNNFSTSDCIGFQYKDNNPSLQANERLKMYAYYLHNYEPRRASIESWLESCDGPYLTYNYKQALSSKEAVVIARESSSGLYVIAKRDSLDGLGGGSSSLSNFYVDLGQSKCLFKGCFQLQAEESRMYTQAGSLEDGRIKTTGSAGFLIYGPYYPVKEGKYEVIFDGDFSNVEGATLQIAANLRTNNEATTVKQTSLVKDKYNYTVSVPVDAEKLEVKIKVKDTSTLSIKGYSFKLKQGSQP